MIDLPPAVAQFIEQLDLAMIKQVILVAFFVFFLVMTIRLLLMRRGRFDGPARIPLDDDQVVTPRKTEGES